MKFFNKKNGIYMALIAIGFFWCGSSYLSQETDIANLLVHDENMVNLIAIGIGSFAMAIGIVLYSVLYKFKVNTKKLLLLFLAICAVLNVFFWVTDQLILKSAILIFTCVIGTAGYGAGYHFALLGNKVEERDVGKCFAVGYALGAIGTYVLTIIPKGDFFSSWYSLFVYIPAIALNFVLIQRYGDIEEKIESEKEEKRRDIGAQTILALCVMVAIMALLANYSSGFLDTLMKGKLEHVVFNRTFYALGLIFAGILADRNKKVLEFATMFSLLFSLVVCVFIREGISVSVMQCVSWIMTGFFAVFRTVFFVELGQKNGKLIPLAGIGLAISRVIEGAYAFVMTFFVMNYLAIILILIVTFMVLFLYYYFRYDKEMRIIRNEQMPENPRERTKEEKIRDFCTQYNLTRREEEVLCLLVEKKSGKEIANELSIAVGTVKNTVSKIYKKTYMKREEIIKQLNS